MDTFLNMQWFSSLSFNMLEFLLSVTLKSASIVLITFLVVQLMRRAAASTRHLIWSVALVSIFLMPIFSFMVPAWHVPISSGFLTKNGIKPKSKLPELDLAINDTQPNSVAAKPQAKLQENKSFPVSGNVETESSNQNILNNFKSNPTPEKENTLILSSSYFTKHWLYFVFAFWGFGVMVILIRHLIGRIYVWWIAQHAREISDDSWRHLSNYLTNRVQIKRSIKLLRSDKANMPMTWGVFRPKILLPVEAEQWSTERKRFVLLHELAHVKRLDSLTQLLAQLTQALYWFNPFVWFANRQLLKEREHACDDYVLSDGTKASDYASLLLDIARSLHNVQFASLATVAMARRTQLEGRLLAILNPQLRRRVLTRLAVSLTVIAAAFMVLPLAAMRPSPKIESITAETKPSPEQKNENFRNLEGNIYSELDSELKPNVKSNSNASSIPSMRKQTEQTEPVKAIINHKNSSSYNTKLTNVKQDKNSYIIRSLSEALKDSILEVRLAAAETLSKIKSLETVQALLSALNDENWQMRETVVESLGDIEDPAAVDAIMQVLQDKDWRVRNQAASALGDIGDSRAVKALGEMLQDDIREVRMNAIQALGDIEDRRAVPALIDILNDEDWEIRKYVAEALSEIDDPSAVNALGAAIEDEHRKVRKAVVSALGEIEDVRSVQPLSKALQDESWEIRKYAAYALGDIEDPSAIEALSACSKDKNPEVRKTAAWALGEIDDYRAVNPLIELLKDEDWEVREKAVWALGEIQDPSAGKALANALKDENREVRKRAIWALGEIEASDAVEALIAVLKDADWEIRKQAARALGEIGDPMALEPLSSALKDENQEVRETAARALGDIKWRN